MVMIRRCFRRANVWAVALLAAGAVVSCAELPSSQRPVQSSNPSVTYNYRTDQELLQANQNATVYCSQYQTAPRTANITNNSDGSKAVVFECVRTTLPAPPPTTPSQSYTYRTDQELVQASHDCWRLLPEIRLAADDVEHGDQPGRKQDRDVPMWPTLS